MRASEMRGLTDEELEREYHQRLTELFNLRFRAQTEQLDNPAQVTKARRDVARIMTILHERRRGLRGA